MECPREFDCFGCIDKNTNFCPLELDEDEGDIQYIPFLKNDCPCFEIEEGEIEDCSECPYSDNEYEEYDEEEIDCDTVEGGCGCCPYEYPICEEHFIDNLGGNDVEELQYDKTKMKFGFRSENQSPLFMLWREYYFKGEVVFAKVLVQLG